uniref:G_PROTEIN_RECEP_F1_2 domain-containing protein n=2 Tax=Caenorhabditis tropicalis TaxID=1561998 RepID=A0A1I7UBH5_9PELO
MIMSNKLYICFAVLNLCSTGLIVLVICINYILVLYELERRRAHLSKSAFQEHKVFIDEIGSHGILIFSMFVTLPCCWFVQFFVLEETDVSFMITICFLVFVSAPIPAMLSFLWRNSRVQMIRIFCCKRNNTVETLAARSLMQAA